MNIDDLSLIEECNNCGCAYFEHNFKDKVLVTQFLCKRCDDLKFEGKHYCQDNLIFVDINHRTCKICGNKWIIGKGWLLTSPSTRSKI